MQFITTTTDTAAVGVAVEVTVKAEVEVGAEAEVEAKEVTTMEETIKEQVLQVHVAVNVVGTMTVKQDAQPAARNADTAIVLVTLWQSVERRGSGQMRCIKRKSQKMTST